MELKEVVDKLGEVDKRFDDIFEYLGILVDDINEMVNAKDEKEFKKQKDDANETLKIVTRKFKKMKYGGRL